MHQLPFGASISEAMLAALKNAAVQARERTPTAIPEIRLIERCGDSMAGLRPSSESRLCFHAEPVNRVAAYSSRPAPELEWAILLFERKYAHSVFAVGDLDVEIGDEAQAALKGKVLDLVDGKIITIPSV
jgi:hypothetical protein